jgi:hypothetical protein
MQQYWKEDYERMSNIISKAVKGMKRPKGANKPKMKKSLALVEVWDVNGNKIEENVRWIISEKYGSWNVHKGVNNKRKQCNGLIFKFKDAS